MLAAVQNWLFVCTMSVATRVCCCFFSFLLPPESELLDALDGKTLLFVPALSGGEKSEHLTELFFSTQGNHKNVCLFAINSQVARKYYQGWRSLVELR